MMNVGRRDPNRDRGLAHPSRSTCSDCGEAKVLIQYEDCRDDQQRVAMVCRRCDCLPR